MQDEEARDVTGADPREVTGDDHRRSIEWVMGLAAGEVGGVLGPHSVTWRLARENVHFLGGLRALLLQLAHPDVAHGVRDHSGFDRHPLRRAYNTFSIVLDMLFGDLAHARRAAMRLHAVHTRIRGTRNDGGAYFANNPRSLLWVFATLVDGIITTHDLLVEPLADSVRARYWDEARLLARLFGIPEDVIPHDYAAFRTYFRDMIDGPGLRVDDVTRAVADAVYDIPLPGLPGAGKRVLRALTAGLMPERLREDYALSWDWRTRAAYSATVRTVQTALPRLPAPVRYVPQAILATWRCRLASLLHGRRAA